MHKGGTPLESQKWLLVNLGEAGGGVEPPGNQSGPENTLTPLIEDLNFYFCEMKVADKRTISPTCTAR